jgi:hypothetical protein
VREFFMLTPIIMIARGEPNLSYGDVWVEHLVDHGQHFGAEVQLMSSSSLTCSNSSAILLCMCGFEYVNNECVFTHT